MAGGCFTDVLHSWKSYHQKHATEPYRLPKDVVADWRAVILRFHGVANLRLICGLECLQMISGLQHNTCH